MGDPQTGENNTKEVLPLLWRFWGSQKGTGNPQGIWSSRPAGFDNRTSIGLGEIDSSLGGYKQNLMYTKTQRKGTVTQNTEPKLLSSVGESPVEVWVSRDRGMPAAVQEGHPRHKPSWRLPITLPESHGLHGWVASGQTTTKEGMKPHPSEYN